MKLSAIILAMSTTEELFKMTSNCINSLIASERAIDMEIIIIESNKNYLNLGFVYPDYVKVIVPDSDFNFHKFLNIGIKVSKGDYVALCNNDLIFQENWFNEIVKISNRHKDILSFSPNGDKVGSNEKHTFEIGYKVQKHIKGWCIVVKREVFDQIGLLDETFDFYYADNDYAMSIKCNNIKHALVFNSHVFHLEKKSSSNSSDIFEEKKDFMDKYKIPDYLLKGKYPWILNNEKSLSGFLKFYNKWGDPALVYRKNKIADMLIKFGLGYFVKFMFRINKNDSIAL